MLCEVYGDPRDVDPAERRQRQVCIRERGAGTRWGESVVVSRRVGTGGGFTFDLFLLDTDTGAVIRRLTETVDAAFAPTVSSVDASLVDISAFVVD